MSRNTEYSVSKSGDDPKSSVTRKITDEVMVRAIRAIGTVAVSHAALRKLFAEHSIIFFAWYYLNINLAPQQARWIRSCLKSRRCLILGPTGHGKTESLAKVLILWLIVYNRNVRILLVSKKGSTGGESTKSLIVVRHILRYNKNIIGDFGRFYSIRNVWQQSHFTVIREIKSKDYTLQSVGMLEAFTGAHYDYIIGDDMIDQHNAESALQRKKGHEYFWGTVYQRLNPDGSIWVIGTRKHAEDIYSELIKNPLWTVIHDKAIIREPADWKIVALEEPILRADGTLQTHDVLIRGDDQGECLWPERFPMAALLLERFEIGTVLFNREKQNEVVDDATASFRMEWLKRCCDESYSYVNWPKGIKRQDYRIIVLGIDPSLILDKKLAEEKDSDYFAAIALGLSQKDGQRHLLGLWRERGMTPDGVEKKIKDIYTDVDPTHCFLEINSFGIIYQWNVVHKLGLKILPHRTDRKKRDTNEGIPALSPLFENTMIRLPYKEPEDKAKTDILIQEFHGLGREKHDDLVMATWIAERGIDRYLLGQANIEKQKEKVLRR